MFWEDGLHEHALSAAEIVKAYAHTPQSLGKQELSSVAPLRLIRDSTQLCQSDRGIFISGNNTVLTVSLLEKLLKIGFQSGEIIESQRVKDVASKLQLQLSSPNLFDIDIISKTLEALNLFVFGVRVSHVVGLNDKSITYSDETGLTMGFDGDIVLTKYPPMKTVVRVLRLSPIDVTKAYLDNIKHDSHIRYTPTSIEDSVSFDWLVMEVKMHESYRWIKYPYYNRYFITIVRYKNFNKTSVNLEFRYFQELAEVFTKSLYLLQFRSERSKERKTFIKTLETDIHDWKSDSIETICQRVCDRITLNLPGNT
jgi:hypothetical protein